MKLLILIIDDDSHSVYKECRNAWRINMKAHPEIDCFFIRGDPNISRQWQVKGDTIFTKSKECFIPGILEKTLLSIGYIFDQGLHYDYILRTNLSSFWFFDRFENLLKDFPKNGVYAGIIGKTNVSNFVSGAGIIISLDIAKKLYDNYKEIIQIPYIDDVAIGIYLIGRNGVKPISIGRIDFIENVIPSDEQIKKVFDNNSNIHIRIKNEKNRDFFDTQIFYKFMKITGLIKNTILDEKYLQSKILSSDINEHIETFRNYTKEYQCKHITELGIRSVVSSWGFLKGLSELDGNKSIVGVDLLDHSNINVFRQVCQEISVEYKFIQGDSAKVTIDPTDILFIDTWHIYGHLKRELSIHHNKVRKFIMMHDTTIDANLGETIRVGWNPQIQSQKSGYPVEEITKGIWPAIEEFLEKHKNEWVLEKRFMNNNGLTILKRVNMLS